MHSESGEKNRMEEILKVEELADYLKVSYSTIIRLAQRGLIPAFRVGGLWRFRFGDIQEWLKKKSLEERLDDNSQNEP